MVDRRRLGAAGEDAVARWYQQRGYSVVARNWRCRHGELDLVVARGSSLVFCEVKTRSSDAFGGPFAAVTAQKQARLRRLVGQFLAEHPELRRGDIRIDVAGVRPSGIDVIEHAC